MNRRSPEGREGWVWYGRGFGCCALCIYLPFSPGMIRFAGAVGSFGESPGAVRPCHIFPRSWGSAETSSRGGGCKSERRRAADRGGNIERDETEWGRFLCQPALEDRDFIIVRCVYVCARAHRTRVCAHGSRDTVDTVRGSAPRQDSRHGGKLSLKRGPRHPRSLATSFYSLNIDVTGCPGT